MDAPRIKLLIDGQCPYCVREARLLERLDKGRGRLVIEDISDAAFDPGAYGLTMPQVMGAMHGVLADGRIVSGVEAFRHAYRAVGRGWLLAPTAWPLLRPLADAAYRLFARNRMRLAGRSGACKNDRCASR